MIFSNLFERLATRKRQRENRKLATFGKPRQELHQQRLHSAAGVHVLVDAHDPRAALKDIAAEMDETKTSKGRP